MLTNPHPAPGAFEPMEARTAEALPTGAGWRFEPKWDGFRCLAFRDGATVDLRGRSGKPLGRYFPEIVAALSVLPAGRFVLDGELVLPAGESLSFDALQARLHPAESRIRRLSRETPAALVAFDLLVDPDGSVLTGRSLAERRTALERFVAANPSPLVQLSPSTADRDAALGWLEGSGGALDGVVAKRSSDPYAPGERAMVKVKRIRTADCVVGGFRYGAGGGEVGSLLLGLYDDDGLLNHVGFTSGIGREERPALTRRLRAIEEPPGFTGRAPGGPSRWSTERSADWRPVRPELVLEVRFDQVTNGRFRHGTRPVRWRADKDPRTCRMDQLDSPTRPPRTPPPAGRR